METRGLISKCPIQGKISTESLLASCQHRSSAGVGSGPRVSVQQGSTLSLRMLPPRNRP